MLHPPHPVPALQQLSRAWLWSAGCRAHCPLSGHIQEPPEVNKTTENLDNWNQMVFSVSQNTVTFVDVPVYHLIGFSSPWKFICMLFEYSLLKGEEKTFPRKTSRYLCRNLCLSWSDLEDRWALALVLVMQLR